MPSTQNMGLDCAEVPSALFCIARENILSKFRKKISYGDLKGLWDPKPYMI